MHKKSRKFTLKVHLFLLHFLLLLVSLCSCYNSEEEAKSVRSFYYWKSVVKLTAFELNRLDSLHVKIIYLKFFDVEWDASTNRAVPVAKIQFEDKRLIAKYQIIPTVFITNSCIQKIDSSHTIELAGKINRLIGDICKINHIPDTGEIQVDCDWTASTYKKYFSLLRSVKYLCKKKISATIRLHQIKFLSQSGVPPVDRGLLMCYNMGNLKNPETGNSIIETGELKKYITRLSAYPLPLDIALPLFEWKVLFRDNIYKGLIQNIPGEIFTNSFTQKKDGRITLLKDSLLAGYDLRKGDVLRSEESGIEVLKAAANEIHKRLKNNQPRVSLYHLDSLTLSKFTTHELESIYNIFP